MNRFFDRWWKCVGIAFAISMVADGLGVKGVTGVVAFAALGYIVIRRFQEAAEASHRARLDEMVRVIEEGVRRGTRAR